MLLKSDLKTGRCLVQSLVPTRTQMVYMFNNSEESVKQV